MVSKLKIHKSTLLSKFNVFKLIEKYPKLMNSSVTLTFLKNYFKESAKKIQTAKKIQESLNK